MDALEHLFRLRVGGMTMMGIRRNETNQVEEVSEPSTQNWAGKAMPIAGLAFLVAEDHETQRSILVRILKDLGAKTYPRGFGRPRCVERHRRPDPIGGYRHQRPRHARHGRHAVHSRVGQGGGSHLDHSRQLRWSASCSAPLRS